MKAAILVLTFSCLFGLEPLTAPMGDSERICEFCNIQNTNMEMFERWTLPAPPDSEANIPWSLHAFGTQIAPGWTSTGCVGGTISGSRGFASIVAGMTTWNDVHYLATTGCDV